MTGRRKTRHTPTSSTGIDGHLSNLNYSENFVAPTSNPHELKFVELPVARKITKIQGWCESGLNLWVDLKIDRDPQSDSDHRDLPQPTASPQGSSPQTQRSDLGSESIVGSNVNTDGASDLPISASLDADEINGHPQTDLDQSTFPLPRTVSPHPSSPQVQCSDLGSRTIFGSNVNTERASGLPISASLGAEVNKIKIIELASDAMQELSFLALVQEPLWKLDTASNTEVLCDFEYEIMVKMRDPQSLPGLDANNSNEFSIGSEQRPEELKPNPVCSESSRETKYFNMSPISIIELLMDLRQWSQAFSNIVSKATIVEVLASAGVERNYDGRLQVMTAEFHAPTPVVPTRKSHFARFCKNLGNSLWGVVDVSLEDLFHIPSRNFRRRPSGCLIEELLTGCSKVIWVEHVEVDNRLVHCCFQPVVSSGFAFGAKRWVNTLIQQFQWSESSFRASSSPAHGAVVIPQSERTFMLKLSRRMVRGFFKDISASTDNEWVLLPGSDIRIAIKSSTDDFGKPPGSTILFATTIHLPAAPRRQVFNLLRDVEFRRQWDLARNRIFEERAYMTYDNNPENCVSKLRAIHEVTKQLDRVLYLQESYTDSTGSYIIYTPFDFEYARPKLMGVENPDHIPILPSGFSILPDRPMHWDETGGSLLTIAFRIRARSPTDDHDYVISNQQMLLIHNIIQRTVMSIKQGLGFYY